MTLLSATDQQKIITQYQRDYGRLMLEYNKSDLSIQSIQNLRNKSAMLREEIKKSISTHRKFFNDENENYAENMIMEINKFIDNYLSNKESNNINLIFSYPTEIAGYAA
jgi:hypothetical protein